ncbi:MAG: IS110 family transposase [Bacteroidetes bacterium]|nr:IS110 family transposase [Bacteroidota bacterium]
MRFYHVQPQQQYFCGVDLHTKAMYLCVLDQAGQILLHKNIRTRPQAFLKAIAPYRQGLVVASECIFCWYWLADLCQREGLDFVLGHALYMRAIHGGKTKNDKLDAEKIALLLRGGMLPQAYAYPQEKRATRDLLRRRSYLVRMRADLLGHVQLTRHQYNLPAFKKRITYKANREGIAERFSDEVVQANVALDLEFIGSLDEQIRPLELYLVRQAKVHDPQAFYLLRSVPGIGKILALTILYEVENIRRFKRVQQFCSYARLVKGQKVSAGKRLGTMGAKMGNRHLKWAFSEATVLLLRESERAKQYLQRLESKHGKGKALSILSAKLGRAVYFMLLRKEPFDQERFFAQA